MQNQPDNNDLPPLQPLDDMSGPVSALPSNAPQPVVVPLPEEANDTDLIEKEWVEKAKQIVEHTSDDPFTQQAQISKVKADYMKKRYDKDVTLPEEG